MAIHAYIPWFAAPSPAPYASSQVVLLFAPLSGIGATPPWNLDPRKTEPQPSKNNNDDNNDENKTAEAKRKRGVFLRKQNCAAEGGKK